MSRFTKTRPETELEKIKQSFPLYDTTELEAEYTTDGKIVFITTNNTALKAILRTQGFTETP